MKKLFLLLLLSLSFTGATYADAICNDGWISESTGSGTCSWHGGVSRWLPDGWCYSNCECYAHKVAQANPKRYGMYYNSALAGCVDRVGGRGRVGVYGNYMAGSMAAEGLLSLFSSPYYNNDRYAPMTNSSYNQGYMEGAGTGTGVSLNSLFTSSDKWKCPSGYKRDIEYGCVKGFVANLYEGVDALNKGDYETAIKHFNLLANHGSANAQFYIGKMYENGISFKKNDYWAHHWINKAAQLGLPDAQFTLGNMYRTGAGVVKDSNQTFKWFKEAGKKGHPSAQFNLGAMYINGDGVDKSLKDAKYWIALANKNGHGRAQEIWDAFELWKY